MTSLFRRSIQFCYFIALLLLASCASNKKNLTTYLGDINNNFESVRPIENNVETKIQPRDLLTISVSSTSPETTSLFSTGAAQAPSTGTGTGNASASASGTSQAGYLVDTEGYIKFPVLGKIKMSGLTAEQASERITNLIAENYVKAPIVNVNISNFRITVIGEVKNPQTFTVPTARVNIFEAIGLAGDVTALGKKNNVLIIRELNGNRSTVKVNLTNKEVLNSPYFYLRQNDIVYVQQGKAARPPQNTLSIVLTVATIISTLSLVATRFR